MTHKSAGEMAAALSLLLHQKLGVRGNGLEAKIARAGRRLPARIRRQATLIAEAEAREASPKLARLTDPVALARAYAEVDRHLAGINPTERRKGAILDFLGSAAMAVIAAFTLAVSVLLWRGFL